ncbi:MAG: SRPBCC family protein [Anaerolineae bacterium]|nr:SRPBCC family protein [Anaerolineae bacterium]
MASVSTTVATTIRAPRAWFFYWFLSVDLSRIMHRYAMLPGVAATRNQTGPMHQVGARRDIVFSDGTTAVEEVTSSDPPRSVAYRVGGLTSAFRHLVREGRGQITFGDGPAEATSVEWRYTFYGRNWAASLLLVPLVSIFWRGFLQATLSRAKSLAEAEAPGSPG